MEPPVASSGPMLRRAATFSHRTERALKDMNGRVCLVNKSQEHLSTSKTSVDVQKVTRPGKQYSAVASRYAAPLVSKKQLSSVRDGPNGGNANVTKLPFITGRSAPQHQRRPSSDNLSSFQPPMVFTASARDPKPDTLAKKVDAAIEAVDAKRPRVAKRTSMIEKKPQVQTRAPRFYSLGKGGCPCSKNGTVSVSVDAPETGIVSLLYSAAHWVSLIKHAEGEKKHDVVIDLFRLATRLKAEPTEDIVGELKRYQESYPGDEAVIQLVEQCEDTQQEVCSLNGEVIDKSVCEAEEAKSAASEAGGDVLDGASESKSVIIPAVVSENEAAMKDVAQKPPHFRGRMLSRSSTFSCVDPKSQSQHAKAEYGKKLAKTMEFLAMQAAAHSASNTEVVVEPSPSEDRDSTGFIVGAKILELASKIGSRLVAGPTSENTSNPVPESGSEMGNGSTEKPGDSSEWLDGDSSETGPWDIESVPTEFTVDLCPKHSPADLNACDRSGESVPHNLHVRRKSSQDAGGQSMTEIVENISRSHRHNLSSEAVQLSVPGSVEEKVKLFTELAEVKGSTQGIAEPSGPKDRQEGEAAESAVDTLAKMESVVDTPEEKECVVNSSAAIETAIEIPVDTDSGIVQNEGSKVPLATPVRMLTKQKSMKSDSVTPSIPSTPSSATPSGPASVGILRARHRRASSVGNMTPRGPIDMTGECSLFGDSSSSPSGQSSSTRSKRVSRGSKEVTPRMDLPKPSWKAIMEREMKGSKLKDLLAAKLPEETSPLAEYVQSQMENQTGDPGRGSTGAKENGLASTRSPAKSVTKMTKSSLLKKKPALKEAQQEGGAELDTAEKQTLNEGEQEMDANTNGCSTPGSAVRRSARIQSKVLSRRNGLYKEEFAHME